MGFKSEQNFRRETLLSAEDAFFYAPREFLNLVALKCHCWCSNTTISVKNLGNLIATFAFSLELSILHSVFFYENLTKISLHESKSGFFQPRSHIGRDSGFSRKMGWLDSLSLNSLKTRVDGFDSVLHFPSVYLRNTHNG